VIKWRKKMADEVNQESTRESVWGTTITMD
jgi:hypothetical protein